MSLQMAELSHQNPEPEADMPALTEEGVLEAARDALGDLLALESVGLAVTGARITGRGSRASVDIYLSDRSEMTFETMRDLANSTRLKVEVAASTGALPKLTAAQALQVVSLVRKIAEHEETFTDDEISREWGRLFLDTAPIVDIDLDDQAQRWKAFSDMRSLEPFEQHRRGEITSIAAGSTVLRDIDGTRYVRIGWFASHVRREQSSLSPSQIAHRMERVGWQRRGTTGRIKASQPSGAGRLGWNFHHVPAGWEE